MVKISIGIIGCGPSGIVNLVVLRELAEKGEIDLVAFDKQEEFGGLWYYTDETETGRDRWGDVTHGSMYKDLWINSAKEISELPDKPYPAGMPSYFPREVFSENLREYVETKRIKKYMKLNTRVDEVTFDEKRDKFSVTHTTYGEKPQVSEFDYLIVATGHFSIPHEPVFNGEETFPGQILHSHLFRDARKYEDKRVLCIGGGYSATDITIQCWKFGAKAVTITSKAPLDLNLPETVEARPILTKIDGSKVTFSDGTSENYDVIIKCTGYVHSFPFMPKELRLETPNVFAPPLYKLSVFPQNSRLFYAGMMNQLYSFSMFWTQAHMIKKFITGELTIPSEEEMLRSIKAEQEKESSLKELTEYIGFQTGHVNEMAQLAGTPSIDTAHIVKKWEQAYKNLATYRDNAYTSIHTGNKGKTGPVWSETKDVKQFKW